MQQPPWFVRLGQGTLLASLVAAVALAMALSLLAAGSGGRPTEVVTETVRVREVVTEHHTPAPDRPGQLSARRQRLEQRERRLDRREHELEALARDLAQRERELVEAVGAAP